MTSLSLFNLQNKHVREGVAKMSELEDPELTSSYEHTKITIIYRATIDEKDQKPSKKIFSTTKNIKKEPQWDGWKDGEMVQLIPTPPGWSTHKGEENNNFWSPPQEARTEPHVRLPSPGILHWKDKPPGHLALKASRAYFPESQRAVGNRNSPIKGCMQRFTHFGTQGRSSHLRGDWARPTSWFWRATCKESSCTTLSQHE